MVDTCTQTILKSKVIRGFGTASNIHSGAPTLYKIQLRPGTAMESLCVTGNRFTYEEVLYGWV